MNGFRWSKLPIVQAPVASAAGAELCAAVCNAGGLGAISLTWRTPEAARALIANVRSLTPGPFYANYVLDFEPKSLETALENGVPIVTFSWGDPSAYVAAVRTAGVSFGIQVTGVESAQRMLDLEPDFLILQGTEAGGHVQGNQPLLDTLPSVVEVAGQKPVIAAGGLSNGVDLAGVLGLGAVAGVFGTRFVASVESEAHPTYKEQLIQARAEDTVLTDCFDGDWPRAFHRVLRNSTYRRWEAAGFPRNGQRPGEGEVVGSAGSGATIFRYDDAMPRVDTDGEWEAMALYAGTSVENIHEIKPAAEIVKEIWLQAQTRFGPTSP